MAFEKKKYYVNNVAGILVVKVEGIAHHKVAFLLFLYFFV